MIPCFNSAQTTEQTELFSYHSTKMIKNMKKLPMPDSNFIPFDVSKENKEMKKSERKKERKEAS